MHGKNVLMTIGMTTEELVATKETLIVECKVRQSPARPDFCQDYNPPCHRCRYARIDHSRLRRYLNQPAVTTMVGQREQGVTTWAGGPIFRAAGGRVMILNDLKVD